MEQVVRMWKRQVKNHRQMQSGVGKKSVASAMFRSIAQALISILTGQKLPINTDQVPADFQSHVI
jgi:hypothetical protein